MSDDGRPQLHATALTMQCGEAFRRRYVEREILPPGVALVVGKATDAAVTRNLQHKINTATLLDVADVAETARDTVVGSFIGDVALDDDERAIGVERVKGAATDKAVRLAVLHAERVAPRLAPVAVQRAFALRVPSVPFDLVGTMDVQESTTIRDTKTSGKTPPSDAADTSVQLTMYHLAATVLDPTPPDAVVLDYLVDTATPRALSVSSTRGPDDYRALFARVEIVNRALVTGTFLPVTPDHWACSPKWCGYFSTCRYVRRPVAVGF